MEIRPADLRRKGFRSALRGYEPSEVNDYLDAVADEYERVHEENIRMREDVSSARSRLEQYEELEDSIRSALVQAEKAAEDLRRSASREADEMRASANRDAELTLREAKSRAHQILADSSSRVERVRESYDALKETRDSFASEFRRLLKGYLDVLESSELASAKEIEAALRDRLDLESIAVAREAANNSPARAENTEDEHNGESTQEFRWRPAEEPPEANEAEQSGNAPPEAGAAEDLDHEESGEDDRTSERAEGSARRREQ